MHIAMSIRLRADQVDLAGDPDAEHGCSSSSSSSDGGGEEETWSDWTSDPQSTLAPCQSLFDDTTHLSAAQALAHGRSHHSFDLDAVCQRLGV